MPISRDQFHHLGDFSDLENLHVYGDLLNLYNLPVTTTTGEAGRLYHEIAAFELQLLTVYVSYILAHKGYHVRILADEEFAESGPKLYTNQFEAQDWVDNFYLFLPMDEPFLFEWEEDYENDKGENVRIIFATLLMTSTNYRTGEELDEAQYLMKHFDDKSSNFAVVHPKLSRKAKKTFLKAKEKMKECTGQDLLLSTGEFVSQMISDAEDRYVVEQNWISLREKLVGHLQKEWPILVYATQQQRIADIDERIRRAKIKHETNEFEEAIMNVGVACEGVLQVLSSIYPVKTVEKPEFYDLLCILREVITEEFGDNIYEDLDFIREWRNNVVHASPTKPDEFASLQVVRKAELFYELFKKKILSKHRH